MEDSVKVDANAGSQWTTEMKQPFLAEDGVSGTILKLDASEWKALLARPTETESPNLVEFFLFL
jgi:hypothetical protein